MNDTADVSEARRHPKIVNGPNLSQKKEFEYNEYEYPPGNSQQVEESAEAEGRHHEHVHVHQHEHEHPHIEHSHHEHPHHDHHEHHEHVHVHHSKSISHPKKPGYSAGSGLRSIAQGSADQASSAVSNQVTSNIFISYYMNLD